MKVSRADGKPLSGGPCRDTETTKTYYVQLDPKSDHAIVKPMACFQKDVVYKIRLEVQPGSGQNTLIDSVRRTTNLSKK